LCTDPPLEDRAVSVHPEFRATLVPKNLYGRTGFAIWSQLLLIQHHEDGAASHGTVIPLPSNVVFVTARAIPRAVTL